MEPLLAELGAQYQGRVDVMRLNADDEPERVRDLGVVAIPTLIAFAGRREIARRTGALSRRDLEALFHAAEAGTPLAPARLLPQDRALRLLAAAAVLAIGLSTGPAWILVAFSGILFFTAIYDRCPIWRAISRRLSFLRRGPRSGGSSPLGNTPPPDLHAMSFVDGDDARHQGH